MPEITNIELKLDDVTVGKILNFTYETPWATGEVEFLEKSLFEKMVAVSSMASFDLEIDECGLEDDQEEKMWEAKLNQLGITWEDLKLNRDGRWSITSDKGDSQPVYSPWFCESGLMKWRC